MPDFSFHRPRFLRFGRSRSRADACDDAGVSSPAGLDLSHTLGPSEQDVDAAPRVARRSISGNLLGSRESLNRAVLDFAGRPVTLTVPIISSCNSVVQSGIRLAPPSDNTHSAQTLQYLAPPPSPYGLATPSQRSFHSETTTPPVGRDSPQPRQQKGMFDRAENFSIAGSTFVDVTVTNKIKTISSKFMKELLRETILGAASDSSARYPPPQCHPGTRLAVLERCLHFIANCDGKRKIRWVVGFAGVGKSAIMQSVVDSPNLLVTYHASLFFSINGRDDGTKAITTLCYQLAVKFEPYRHFIEHEVSRDPSLLQASMPVQFKKFIVEPFIQSRLLNSLERILIIIDGLDECEKRDIQLELLRLISDFCITYPSSPLVWFIASRPESHITSFFARADVMPVYEKEEIQEDSDDGRADVENFLREKLEEIKRGSNAFDPHSKWPEAKDFWKLAEAAGGLFAYADTVTKYIGDLDVGSPALLLSDVLKVIYNHPMTGIQREEHPLALLDALYARILSNVPAKVIVHARKLVLALASSWDSPLNSYRRGTHRRGTFVDLCNWLAMTPDEAYAAINQLQSLLRAPRREQAHLEELEPFHKSFIDYVSDSSRSKFLPPDMYQEAQQVKAECALRILKEAPDGVDFGDVNYETLYGTLRRGPGTGDKISLTWHVDGSVCYLRLTVFKMAVAAVVKGFINRDSRFTSEFCVRFLITQFASYEDNLELVLNLQVFDESRRHEFTRCGLLKKMRLKAVPGIPKIRASDIELRFRCPARAVTSLSDPWNLSCTHEREGEWDRGKDQDWKTDFWGWNSECSFCCDRFDRQVKSLTTHYPDHTVSVLFTYAGKYCVELRFVDPDDGISKWTYQAWIELSPEERKELGSTI